MAKNTILIVADDQDVSESLKVNFPLVQYDVITVGNKEAMSSEIDRQFFNAVILSQKLFLADGAEFLRVLNIKLPDTCVVLAMENAQADDKVIREGIYDYIYKPYDSIAARAAIEHGIEKQGLLFKNRDLIHRLVKEKTSLGIILNASKKMVNILKFDTLAEFVSNCVMQVVGADKVSLMLIDDATSDLVLVGSRGMRISMAEADYTIGMGGRIAGMVAQKGEVLLVNDIDTDPRFKEFARNSKYKTKSFVCLPLKTEEKIIGVMNVTDKLTNVKVFNEDDIRYLMLIANQTLSQIENIKLYQRLSSFAITDSLTGLYNHRHIHERLEMEIMRVERYHHPLSMVIFDIDEFKFYNDTYGHLQGDEVLKAAAKRIKEGIRKVDMAGRYAGDEFVVVLPEASVKDGHVIAERILQGLQNLEIINQQTKVRLKVTMSAGVALFYEGMSKDDLISRADQALYKAKDLGKNRAVLFEV